MNTAKAKKIIVYGALLAYISWVIALELHIVQMPSFGNPPLFTSYLEIVSTIAFVIVAIPAAFQIYWRFFQNPSWNSLYP